MLPLAMLGAGYPRAKKLLEVLIEAGHPVSFLPVGPTTARPFFGDAIHADLEVLGGVYAGPTGVERVLRDRPGYFTDLLISRPNIMGALRFILDLEPAILAGIRLTYDAEALFTLRKIGELELAGHHISPADRKRHVANELSLSRGADRVLAVSAAEAEIFRNHGFETAVVGYGASATLSEASWESRFDFVFVGAIHGDAGPNFDSMMWFLNRVWPDLAGRCPAARFIMAGLNDSISLRSQQLPNRVISTGALPDLSAVYDTARVFVAPTRFGAGIPLKVIDAAARGVPVVATSLVSNLLGWDPECVAAADSPDEFIAQCVRIYSDEQAWRRQREGGLSAVEAEYSDQVFTAQVRAALRLG